MDRAATSATSPRRLLILIVLYLVVVMGLGFIYHTYGDGETETDFYGAYAPQADAFLHGRIDIDAFRGPLYPIVVAVVQSVGRMFGTDLYTSGKIVSGLSAGLALFFAYRLTLTLFSPLVALGVLVLTMLNPIFVRYTYTAGNDMFFLFIVLLGLFVLLGDSRGGWKRVVLTGAVCGVAALTRYNAIGFLAGIVAAIIFLNVWKQSWRQRIVAAAVLCVVCLAVFVPWGLYCKAEKGQFFYNRNYENLAMGIYVDTQEEVRPFMVENRAKLDGFLSVMMIDPPTFFGSVARQVMLRWTKLDEVVSRPVATMAFLGLLLMVIRPPTRRQGAWLVCGLLFFLVLAPIFFSPRFYLMHVPLLLAVAVQGVVVLGEFLHGHVRAARGLALVLLVLVITGAVSTVSYNREYIGGQGFGPLCDLGKRFAEVRPMDEGKRVMARKPHFGYYARLVTIPFPPVDEYPELLERARSRGADYLLFTSGTESTRPGLMRLADINAINPGLRQAVTSPFGILYEVER